MSKESTVIASPRINQGGSAAPAKRRLHPAFFVPSLYFAEGVPYNVVNFLLANMYKNMGVSNAAIAFHTSLLVLAWTVKPLWSPIIEMFATKRHWILAVQFGMAVAMGCVALALPLPGYMPISLACMWVVAFLSATNDISTDGLYISVMNSKEQSAWVGVQGFFWTMSKVVMTGVFVVLSGKLHASGMSWAQSWLIVMLLVGASMLVMATYHLKTCPQDVRSVDRPRSLGEAMSLMKVSWFSFFQKQDFLRIAAFILLYKISIGFLDRIGPLFLLDARDVGGLGLDNVVKGSIDGIWGTTGLLAGTILAGFYVSKVTLNRYSLLLLCAALNLPTAAFIYLSQTMPESPWVVSFWVVFEKLGSGFGEVGLMLYMMQQVAPGKFRTAHYAFATGLMNLGYTFGGMPSGWIQEQMGYAPFFIFVMALAIPSFLASWFAPFNVKYDPKTGDLVEDRLSR